MLKAHKARQTVGARAWASDMVESNAAGRAYRAMKSLLGTIKADPQLAAVSALGLCASVSEHGVCAGLQAIPNSEKREMIVLLSHDTPVISTPIIEHGPPPPHTHAHTHHTHTHAHTHTHTHTHQLLPTLFRLSSVICTCAGPGRATRLLQFPKGREINQLDRRRGTPVARSYSCRYWQPIGHETFAPSETNRA
jgi:hypothetical protein